MNTALYTLKVGDLLEYDGKFGLITKVRPRTFQYYICSNPADNGAFFDEKKDNVYRYIDEGECKHHLIGNTTKYRRKRDANQA
tara:strand:+ start:955 stop:1203 length:249 start_codon:yes stop_codon:yes gene_type:complete